LAVLAGLVGFLAGAVLSIFGFTALWWSFPGAWTAATGLTGVPQAILGMDIPQRVIYLQTVDGGQFACLEGECAPAPLAAIMQPCTADSRPAVTALFPLVVNWNASTALGCELSYQSTGRTAFVLIDRQGRAYFAGGPTFLPTDAGVIGVGIVGGLIAAAVVILTAVILLFVRSQSQAKTTAGDPASAVNA